MPDALKVSEFHGPNRPKEIEPSVDVVLTTYATLASNHDENSVFHKTEWYRVVLDEGKIINLEKMTLISLSDYKSTLDSKLLLQAVQSCRPA